MNLAERRLGAALVGTTLPERAFRAALVLVLPVLYVAGRRQSFIRDDWAFLLTRPLIREREGVAAWLFTAQDGHWMTPPLLVYRAIQNAFGMDSYWPFLVPTMALHVVAVCLVRSICRRHGVGAWTTTALSVLLLVFGSGWEDVVFAIQLVYNLSLVAFLAMVLLVDHDGPPDRRDAWAAVLGVVSITSSGFGPFFLVGIGLLLALRRRRLALVIVTVPQALLYAWWWLVWGEDPVGATSAHTLPGTARYARLGITATLNGVTGQVLFAGAAFIGIVAMCAWLRLDWRVRTTFLALAGTVAAFFLGIGYQRAGLGLESATVSRYQYMAAMLLVPPLGLAVDQLARFHRWALLVGYAVLAVSILQNGRLLLRQSDDWADRAHAARRLFSLVAADPRTPDADQALHMSAFNPDVNLAALPQLRRAGLLDAHAVPTDAERALVDQVLAGTPVDDMFGAPPALTAP